MVCQPGCAELDFGASFTNGTWPMSLRVRPSRWASPTISPNIAKCTGQQCGGFLFTGDPVGLFSLSNLSNSSLSASPPPSELSALSSGGAMLSGTPSVFPAVAILVRCGLVLSVQTPPSELSPTIQGEIAASRPRNLPTMARPAAGSCFSELVEEIGGLATAPCRTTFRTRPARLQNRTFKNCVHLNSGSARVSARPLHHSGAALASAAEPHAHGGR